MAVTKEQKLEAYSMLLNGDSTTKIASKFGVSRQYICTLFPVTSIRKEMAADSCVFPNISKWMRKNNFGYTDFARRAGTYSEKVRYALTSGNPTKCVIDAVLEATGMTYEEAFGK